MAINRRGPWCLVKQQIEKYGRGNLKKSNGSKENNIENIENAFLFDFVKQFFYIL